MKMYSLILLLVLANSDRAHATPLYSLQELVRQEKKNLLHTLDWLLERTGNMPDLIR